MKGHLTNTLNLRELLSHDQQQGNVLDFTDTDDLIHSIKNKNDVRPVKSLIKPKTGGYSDIFARLKLSNSVGDGLAIKLPVKGPEYRKTVFGPYPTLRLKYMMSEQIQTSAAKELQKI